MKPLQQARRASAGLLAAAAVAGAIAAPSPATEPPSVAREVLAAPHLQGQASVRFFGLPIYDAQLWVGPGFDAKQPLSQPFVLQLRYRRHLEGRAIAERSLQEMQRLAAIGVDEAALWRQQMIASFPDVHDGDRLSGVYRPGQPVEFVWNDRPIARIAGDRFARLFFGIWLAPGTSEPALRSQLLGVGGAQP
jgi:hypothetical protein